jgi:Zn-dependent protease with chaperone function
MATVLLSYLFAIILALAFLLLPFVLLSFVPVEVGEFLLGRLLLSAFGLVVGVTIFWSLLPGSDPFDPNGILIDLSRERRLAKEIESIADVLHEPMPSEVYLIADADAFVLEISGSGGSGKRRIIGLGLPLLQMLTLAQFRAVLAHEFGHYYAGDTRLGPWVYDARRAMEQVYKNLGRKSDVLGFFRRSWIVAGPHKILMASLRVYWKLFMRVTQAISRQQEFRSDELACYIAGSQALIEGLEGICRCKVGLNAYWNSFVLPVAEGGFQPDLANGFQQFMQTPQITKATTEYLSRQASVAKPSPFDSHPPLNMRIDQARLLNLPTPKSSLVDEGSNLPMISFIENLGSLEANLIKRVVPVLATADLKPLNWETAGTEIYIPAWHKQVQNFLPFLSTKKMVDLPLLVLDPRPVAELVPNPSTGRLNQTQRVACAIDVLFSAFALCLLRNGWKLTTLPGPIILENGKSAIDPGAVIGAIRAGTLSVVAWKSFRAERGILDWPLAAPIASHSAS